VLKAKLLAEDGSVSPVEGSIHVPPVSAAKNICFIGAGFVGMVESCVSVEVKHELTMS
jgi:hypothetical protein